VGLLGKQEGKAGAGLKSWGEKKARGGGELVDEVHQFLPKTKDKNERNPVPGWGFGGHKASWGFTCNTRGPG